MFNDSLENKGNKGELSSERVVSFNENKTQVL